MATKKYIVANELLEWLKEQNTDGNKSVYKYIINPFVIKTNYSHHNVWKAWYLLRELGRIDGKHKTHIVKSYNPVVNDGGLWCPRCGGKFHDSDILKYPEQFFICDCGAIQHEKCRGLSK